MKFFFDNSSGFWAGMAAQAYLSTGTFSGFAIALAVLFGLASAVAHSFD